MRRIDRRIIFDLMTASGLIGISFEEFNNRCDDVPTACELTDNIFSFNNQSALKKFITLLLVTSN